TSEVVLGDATPAFFEGAAQTHRHPLRPTPDVGPGPTDDDVAERLDLLLAQLLPAQGPTLILVVVFQQSVRLADDAELLPEEVHDDPRIAELIMNKDHLQLRRRHTHFVERNPADALQR